MIFKIMVVSSILKNYKDEKVIIVYELFSIANHGL